MTPAAGALHRAAVLDIGSNSVLLLTVAVAPDGRARGIDAGLATTRLGTGLGPGGRLDASARARTEQAVATFAARARQGGAERLWAFGTGALRRACDGAEAARALAVAAGTAVEVLSEEREGRLAYSAAVHGLDAGKEPVVVADIGGATTEITLGRGETVEATASLPVGALELAERRAASQADDLGMTGHPLLARARAAGARLIVSGGTATALAAVALGLRAYDAARVHGHIIAAEALRALVRRLVTDGVPAGMLDPERAAILPAGALVLEGIARALGADAVQVSDHGVRHAYLRERLAETGIVADFRHLWS
jgi:exopolyphosphatase/guanosine-5'-triphosphate,3'-diphosphate pyrophosphatase